MSLAAPQLLLLYWLLSSWFSFKNLHFFILSNSKWSNLLDIPLKWRWKTWLDLKVPVVIIHILNSAQVKWLTHVGELQDKISLQAAIFQEELSFSSSCKPLYCVFSDLCLDPGMSSDLLHYACSGTSDNYFSNRNQQFEGQKTMQEYKQKSDDKDGWGTKLSTAFPRAGFWIILDTGQQTCLDVSAQSSSQKSWA